MHWSGVFVMVFDSECYVTNMMVSRFGGYGRLWGKFSGCLMGSQC